MWRLYCNTPTRDGAAQLIFNMCSTLRSFKMNPRLTCEPSGLAFHPKQLSWSRVCPCLCCICREGLKRRRRSWRRPCWNANCTFCLFEIAVAESSGRNIVGGSCLLYLFTCNFPTSHPAHVELIDSPFTLSRLFSFFLFPSCSHILLPCCFPPYLSFFFSF